MLWHCGSGVECYFIYNRKYLCTLLISFYAPTRTNDDESLIRPTQDSNYVNLHFFFEYASSIIIT